MAKRERRQPQRTCIGCRETGTKREFVRIVRTPAGRVGVDETGKASGRGAYLHERAGCWELALKRGTIKHALRIPDGISRDELDMIRAFFATLEGRHGEAQHGTDTITGTISG